MSGQKETALAVITDGDKTTTTTTTKQNKNCIKISTHIRLARTLILDQAI